MSKTALMIFFMISIAGIVCSQTAPDASATPKQTENNMVKYFSKDDVAASFAKGGTLADQGNYKVMTAHRTEGGTAEAHRNFTDVFYIVQGSTTMVTGGKMVGETSANSDEPRGKSIEGGQTQEMSAGDVIVIPAGVPHWMKDVKGTLLYFVVKVKAEK